MYDKLWLIFLTSFVVSMAVTPLAIKLAPKIGAMDVPKDARRMHTKAIPRFGGLAIFAGTMASMAFFLNFDKQVVGMMIGGVLIYLLGIIDDLKNLPAKVKLLGQVLVAVIMYMYGLRIEFLTNFFGEGNMAFATPVSFIITIVWIVGITNAVNLIDGLDGLAAGTSAIAALCLAYVAYIYGQYLSAAAMLALAGGALGFLPYNFYPAKIFMGDGGSLFLGFMLATLSVMGLTKGAAVIATSVPVFVLGLPIFDTFFAIFRRMVNKRPIMEADKGHLHHRLMQLGYGQRRATLMIYGISAIMGIAAVMFSRGLNVEGLGLVGVALMDIYIFLTDPNHVLPQIRQEKEAAQQAKTAAKAAPAATTASAEPEGAENAAAPAEQADAAGAECEEKPEAEAEQGDDAVSGAQNPEEK